MFVFSDLILTESYDPFRAPSCMIWPNTVVFVV